jgi:hypothetical protein
MLVSYQPLDVQAYQCSGTLQVSPELLNKYMNTEY